MLKPRLKIVCEGVNASGKSTLSDALSKYFDVPKYHPGPAPACNKDAIENCVHQLACERMVFDRVTAISRLAYENLDKMKVSHYNVLLRYLSLMKKECVFIHCVGHGEHIIKPYYTNSHIVTITRDRDIIRNNYFKLFERIPHFEYDFNINTVEEVVDYILPFVNS